MSEPIFKGLPGTMALIKQEINAYIHDSGGFVTENELMEKLTEIVRRYGNEQVSVTMAMNTAMQESSFSTGLYQQRPGDDYPTYGARPRGPDSEHFLFDEAYRFDPETYQESGRTELCAGPGKCVACDTYGLRIMRQGEQNND